MCEDALVFGRLWGTQTRAAGQVLFHAVAIGEPAGKPLRDCRMVEVRLTLRADRDLELRRTHGLAALNRTLVVRLCGEALEQQAVLSIEDLADMGPALTHRDRIVKLFLQGFSESEVAGRTQHTLGCVEQHLSDFLRISLLHQDRYFPGETARLTRLSEGKVQGHLRLTLLDPDDLVQASDGTRWD